MRYFALPLLLLAGSPAFAADQFDLACKGYRWTQRGGAGEVADFRLRVDLAAGRWCEGACKPVQSIVSVAPDKLVLTDDSTVNTRMDMIREVTFDRKTNAFSHHFLQARPDEQYMDIRATCTTEPFTPFPG